jgi:phenylacetate-coenzyme A ligase PaaK-like adenylate-forming protein
VSGYEELRQRQVADLAGRMPEHMESFPVDLPIDEIVAGLNGLQPVTLVGYASVLVRLAAEARSGRLEIAPKRIITTSEPLPPHDRQSIQDALGHRSPTCGPRRR